MKLRPEAIKREEQISKTLKSVFGFDSLRLDQEQVIHSCLDKKDTLVIMPTGGGKSLCYQLPALLSEGVTVVISPLISLMHDQVVNLKQYGIEAEFLNSTLDFNERRAVEARLKEGQVNLIYMAPEGVLSTNTLCFLKELNISLFAVDEAHCVSQWGHEFRGDYTRLNELKEVFPEVPMLALTATADHRTRLDICDQLSLKDPNIYVSGFDRPNIKYMIYERIDEIKQLNDFIIENHLGETGIVYCLSRKKVERVADELQKLGYTALPYHAGLTTKKRTQVQNRFKSQEAIIIVATIAFGMGIDRPDVKFVAHLDLPKSIEGYYQETGRAGRDGAPANAWMVYGMSDVVKLSRMLETTDAKESYKKIARFKLDAMLALCESTECRRHLLLRYFGEHLKDPCGNCDACLEPQELVDSTVEAQKILSTIFRTGQMFGGSHVIDVLRGSQNNKVLTNKHEQLSVYGIGKQRPKTYWSSVLRQLLTLNYVKIKDWEFKSLVLTEKSRDLLLGKELLMLRPYRDLKGKKLQNKLHKKILNTTHDHPELFESLRAHRLLLAKEGKVPPYLIFSDKTLTDMCNILPQDRTHMLMVHGVGESKLNKYGHSFLEIIDSYNQKNTL